MHIAFIPRTFMQKHCSSESDAIHLNVIISYFLLALLIFLPNSLYFVTSLPHLCLFDFVLGFPCPGCDIIAALAALARFDFYRSLMIQPCGFAFVAIIFIQSIIRGAYLLRFMDVKQTNQWVLVLNRIFLSSLLLFWVLRLLNHK
jgi:hypothetical protein